MKSLPHHPVIVASHRRSGTHLTIDFVRKNFKVARARKWPLQPNDRLYLNFDAVENPDHPSSRSRESAYRFLNRVRMPIVKTHLSRNDFLISLESLNLEDIFRSAMVLYVVRDPRSVMASFYAFREGTVGGKRISFSEFLRGDGSAPGPLDHWIRHVESWLDHPRVLVVRFEQLKSDPYQVLNSIASKFDITLERSDADLPKRRAHGTLRRVIDRLAFYSESTAIMERIPGVIGNKQNLASDFECREIQQRTESILKRLGYLA